jgi:hypothetical protein
MSTLTTVLVVLAAVLGVASIAGIYITNVTARPTPIPRWVAVLGAATLLVGFAAVLSFIL